MMFIGSPNADGDQLPARVLEGGAVALAFRERLKPTRAQRALRRGDGTHR
jgi:hypothetical protein